MALTAPTVTGYSAFWSNLLSPTQGGGGYSMSQDKARSKNAYHVAKFFNKGNMRDARGALAALIGAAAGGTATNQFKRVGSPASVSGAVPVPTGLAALGGNRTIDTVDAINRATTSADVTELKKWFAQNLLESGITYPTVVGNSLSSGMQVGGTGRF